MREQLKLLGPNPKHEEICIQSREFDRKLNNKMDEFKLAIARKLNESDLNQIVANRPTGLFFGYCVDLKSLPVLLEDAYVKTKAECDLYDDLVEGRTLVINLAFTSGQS